ncbi:MutS family protein [Martiniozyma asiatica (nom. inval.)]|nr:MutS family protein [Martiniozyma asiatica]
MYSLNIINLNTCKEKKTLYGLLGKTSSKIGTFTLKSYIMRPLSNLAKIVERLNTVEQIVNEMGRASNMTLPLNLMNCLHGISDIRRIAASLRIGNFKPLIWKNLRKYVINIIEIEKIINSSTLKECPLFEKYLQLVDVPIAIEIQRILENVLDFDSNPNDISIKAGVDPELDRYIQMYSQMENILESVANDLSNEVGIAISIGYFPQMGYLAFIDDEELSIDSYELIFKTDTSYYYKCPQMTELDDQFGDISSIVDDIQSTVLQNLKDSIIDHLISLERVYSTLGEIDVILAFGKVAFDFGFCKPKMTESTCLELKEASNPLTNVENYISSTFNFVQNKVSIITGPNYSGKSTFLNMVGLIIFMAQIGSFVPCKSAHIGIVDSILTRINTFDTSFSLKSTFFKDCIQMGKCITSITSSSLIIIDEFGKGTDVIEGYALLASVLKYFTNIVKESRSGKCPRIILCTHMIEIFKRKLVDFDDFLIHSQMKVIASDNVSVKDSKITYLYQLASGMSADSLGLYCMKKSGVDEETVRRAADIRRQIDREEFLVLGNTNDYQKESEKIEKILESIFNLNIADRLDKVNVDDSHELIALSSAVRSQIREIFNGALNTKSPP